MIEYFEQLMQEEQEALTEVIQTLYHQTFLLEQKFDKRAGRFRYEKEYRLCSKHIEFLKSYFAVAGITLQENAYMGLIYIEGETLWGEKLPRLATIYLLVLKLIYDEQMESVSTSVNVYTTLREIHEKLGNYRLFKKQPSPTDIRRAVTLLKKYQILDPLDLLEDLNSESRMIIYPCINVVLMGDDARQLLAFFDESAEDEGVQVKADLDEGSRERPAQSLGLDDRGGDEDGTDEDESDGTGPYGTDGEPDRE